MKKYLKVTAAVVLAVLLSLQQALPAKAWEETISCTVLGDSISKGYSSDKENKIKCYGQILTEQISEENKISYDYHNYAKNGLDTRSLNEKTLAKDSVLRSLNKADLILITMGSNDLLNQFKQETQEILNSDTKIKSVGQAMEELQAEVKKNPLLVLKVVDALSNWDYGTFETQWAEAMETITQQKKDGAQIIVTNIYNPVYNMELPGTMNKVVEGIIQNMNGIIEKRADEFDYQVIDLFHSGIVEYVQDDGLHPSQEGQQLIAEMVYPQIEASQSEKETTQSVDGEASKGEDDASEESPGTLAGQEQISENKQNDIKDVKDEETLQFNTILTAAAFIILILVVAGIIKNRK